MKIMLQALTMLVLAVVLTGCKEERQPKQPESIYQGLDKPVDRSKSKEY